MSPGTSSHVLNRRSSGRIKNVMSSKLRPDKSTPHAGICFDSKKRYAARRFSRIQSGSPLSEDISSTIFCEMPLPVRDTHRSGSDRSHTASASEIFESSFTIAFFRPTDQLFSLRGLQILSEAQ